MRVPPTMNWGGQRLLCRHTPAPHPVSHSIERYAHRETCGADGRKLNTADIYPDVATPIGDLLGWGGPSAIIRRVRAVWINSVNRMAIGWLRSHVCNKIGEHLPPIANANTAPTVAMVIFARRLSASAVHFTPSLKERVLSVSHVQHIADSCFVLKQKGA